MDTQLSTGLPGLDRMLKGLLPGDNVVWQVDSIDDYVPLVRPYVEKAVLQGRRVIYFRFARHADLIQNMPGVDVHTLNPEDGFEAFIDAIHHTIEEAGRGAFYVFDCLSDLAVDWYSDRMVGNFFMLTCPYLYDLATITYFALLRDCHSVHATTPIGDTTQLLLNVYRHEERLYVHPIKVQHRYSPTMHMLHVWEGDAFSPVTESHTIAEVLSSAERSPLDSAGARLGVWHRTLLEAEETMAELDAFHRAGIGLGDSEHPEYNAVRQRSKVLFERLLRMMVSRDDRVLRLAKRYLTMADVIQVAKRLIGTGLIGGKSVGMLLARAILRQAHARWSCLLEVHDSFFIGSDVFYTYLVCNGCWWVRQKQRNPKTFLEGAETGRQRILTGTFPDYIAHQFEDMLEYFGQSPIIVRSSSLLEDNFGNAFAGKYESVFCANQGSRHKRLEDFLSAVRTIYASTMSEKALSYRAQRGLLEHDEQMALLVQRVSGGIHGSYFYPHVAGVGFSFNSYVWSEYIEPKAGVLRLVFGLGTRAVDRSDDDYTRLVALNAPERRPETDFERARQHTQRKVDAIDLEGNLLVSTDFATAVNAPPTSGLAHSARLPLELFASRDEQLERLARDRIGRGGQPDEIFPWVLTFDELFSQTPFVKDMREMLETLQAAYEYPVDIEFTANFFKEAERGYDYRINLVQCRPLQVKGGTAVVDPPADIGRESILLRSRGPVIGQSRVDTIDRIIYVVPSEYARLPNQDRYSIARIIGQITHLDEPGEAQGRPPTVFLIGPGRWGTTTPSLGVPVSFAEINTVSIICEIVAMRDDLVPDVSLGTHFFSDLVEGDILYLALFPHHEESVFNAELLEKAPNRLAELLPRASAYAHVVRVIDGPKAFDGRVLRANANALKQRVLCYLDVADKRP